MFSCEPSSKCAITLVVLGCCALLATTSFSQTPARQAVGRGPINPLRALPTSAGVLQAQATEPLPSPLRGPPTGNNPFADSATEPRLAPTQIGPMQPVPAPGERLLLEQNSAQGWPADAPAYDQLEHHGGGHGSHGHPPRDAWFAHDDPNDIARHTGWGEPLVGTSWRNRPWYWGIFMGGILNDGIVGGHVEQDNAPFLGLRLGNDFDHFWGWEGRYAFARTELFNGVGAPIAEEGRNYYVDVALLHYPWGDSRWRPYFLAGLGFANFRFENDLGQRIDDTALTIPLGIGLKHYYSPWFSLRFDAVDNFAIGTSRLDTMHNFSLMVGVEFRFGGNRPNYFPWHGNTTFW
ncbi:hypothetical protein ETAA8_68280 [Anatilimnocola aggregata]|uniref:Outer membrane protein beta-barrel domain-containing protein n=1 Tax=Anatilimnocola aggregata TaxID=2528021 RepID=A0A517YN77_9BACT|nr:porin family protein [Anatilimnocola aggregata]QDU31668.1 hypothetical protein ETAA8_68280 [Anatilimnocola aggregata]